MKTVSPVRRALITTLLCSSLFMMPSMGMANNNYPTGPVTMMVPYPAGGPSDSIARVLSGPIGKQLGVQVIVENLGGATGSIAANKVLNAKADGSYFFQGTANELILPPLTNSAIKFKPNDFRSVHPITTSNLVLLVKQDLPVNSVEDFIELAKEQASGTPLTYGSVGVGSLYHLISDRLSQTLDANLVHVPYRGTTNVMQDLAGGQIDFAIQAFSKNMKDMEKEGRYKILAVLSKEKPEILQEYPILSDAKGFEDFNYFTGSSYLVKKDTPEHIVEKLNKAISAAVQEPEVRNALGADGRVVANPMTPAQANDFYQAEIRQTEDVIKQTGFKGN